MYSRYINICNKFNLKIEFDSRAMFSNFLSDFPQATEYVQNKNNVYIIKFFIANPIKDILPDNTKIYSNLNNRNYYFINENMEYICLSDSLQEQMMQYSWIIKYAISNIGVEFNLLTLHSSGVEKNGYAMLFIGAKGSGKSSFSNYCVQHKNYNFIGDDFIILDCETLCVWGLSCECFIQQPNTISKKDKIVLRTEFNSDGCNLKLCFFPFINPFIDAKKIIKITTDQLVPALMRNSWSKHNQINISSNLINRMGIESFVSITNCDLKRNIDLYNRVFNIVNNEKEGVTNEMVTI